MFYRIFQRVGTAISEAVNPQDPELHITGDRVLVKIEAELRTRLYERIATSNVTVGQRGGLVRGLFGILQDTAGNYNFFLAATS